jgi:hypothetical protein
MRTIFTIAGMVIGTFLHASCAVEETRPNSTPVVSSHRMELDVILDLARVSPLHSHVLSDGTVLDGHGLNLGIWEFCCPEQHPDFLGDDGTSRLTCIDSGCDEFEHFDCCDAHPATHTEGDQRRFEIPPF